MKKRSLSLLSLVCALCLVLFACRKEIGQIIDTEIPKVSAVKLESAKIYNAKFIAKHLTENSKQPGFVTLNPLWDQAWTLKAAGGNEYVAVPTAIDYIDQLNVTISRLFLFEMSGDEVENAEITEFVGLNYSVEREQDKLILNNKNTSISGFNGAIIHYDLNYRWKGGSIFEDGAVKLTNAAITRKVTFAEPASVEKIPLYLSTLSKTSTGSFTITNYKYLFTPSGRLRVAADGSGSGVTSGMGGDLSVVNVTSTAGGGGGTNTGGTTGPGGNPPPNTGGGTTGGNNSVSARLDNLLLTNYVAPGNKPLFEYSSVCNGISSVESLSQNHSKEVIALVSQDGKLMVIAVTGPNGGSFKGLIRDPDTGIVYYYYPSTDGAPGQQYQGIISGGPRYYIPVKATLHTHPCNTTESTDGVTGYNLSSSDHDMAVKFPTLRNYILGCYALGSFTKNSEHPQLEQQGSNNQLCTIVQ